MSISDQSVIDVIIPAYNEEKSIGFVLQDIPKDLVRNIYVCNNGSTDNTAAASAAHGATVVDAPNAGYGNACLAGMKVIANGDHPDLVVFLDGDYSDYPEEMVKLVKPLIDQEQDLVIGSRVTGEMEKGAMLPQQIFGNWLATNLIRIFYGYEFTDLGPFRAIRYDRLIELDMQDKDFGWTVEMQVKAAKKRLRCTEIPVSYRKRIGVSKVSGTIKGTLLAGHKILWTIFKLL